jgi:hypothetical protein
MVLANVVDTILNIGVFGFVALLFYLWRKPMPKAPPRGDG